MQSEPLVMFEAQDFAAYLPSKRASNSYTLERMRVKDKLKLLEPQLRTALGGHARTLVSHWSDEFPSISNHKSVAGQWLYLHREDVQRKRLSQFMPKTELSAERIFAVTADDQHISLFVCVNEAAIEYGLTLPGAASLGRLNWARKLAHAWHVEAFTAIAGAVSPEWQVYLGTQTLPLRELPAHQERLVQLLNDQQTPIQIICRDDSAHVMAQPQTWLSTLLARMAEVAPLYHFAAWSLENDHLGTAEAAASERAASRTVSDFKVGDTVVVLTGMLAHKQGVVTQLLGKERYTIRVGAFHVTLTQGDFSRAS